MIAFGAVALPRSREVAGSNSHSSFRNPTAGEMFLPPDPREITTDISAPNVYHFHQLDLMMFASVREIVFNPSTLP